jgi:Putative peptidoglycan binding domain
MKKFTSLLIGVSLVLAGAAFAQQPEEQASPGKKQGAEKTQPAEPKPPKTRAEQPAKPAATAKQTGAMNEQGATGEQGPGKGRKGREKAATGAGTETGVSGQTGAGATTEPGAAKGKKGRAQVETSAGAGANVSAEPSASVAPGGKAGRQWKAGGANANAKTSPNMTPATAASAGAAPSVAASTNAAPSVAATGQQNTTANATGGGVTKADPQKVQQVKQQAQTIKQEHVNFRAQARPDRVPAVTFSQNYRIEGSDRWQGPQYEVFRSYHPERHDRNWYHSRYQRVELIGGGYYYWNSGYWYPAWGYDPGNEYYAYDAPIYVGHHAEPPDRVIADVQAELQQMGYYQGEVDGLLGPLTREALQAYQADQGLEVTAVIDEPTLDSLGMS